MTEQRAPHIESKGKGAADIDRPKQFPSYDNDFEVSPGAENNTKSNHN